MVAPTPILLKDGVELRYLNDPEALYKLLRVLMEGMGPTLTIFAWTLILSLPLGLLVALGRMSKYKWISAPISFYILIMRGTPLMLQIFAVHFALPTLLGRPIDRMTSTILSFALNYAAYFAEIYRGGILSINVGQYEAGKVLGFTRQQTFVRIVLPQVFKRILLPVSNEVITLVKDTSLARVIAVADLFRVAQTQASNAASIAPLFIAGAFYLAMNSVVTKVFSILIKKFNYYQG